MNILESLWIKHFYEPHVKTLLNCFKYEVMKTHDCERFEDLFCEKATVQKFLKIMK